MPSDELKPDEPKVVAAIDFGTHGTGFAWALKTPLNDDPETRRVQWHSRFPLGNLAYPKNLTALLLDAEGDLVAWGYKARKQWSDALKEGAAEGLGYAYAFKMALKGGSALDLPTVGGHVDLSDRDLVRKLISVYLREIRARAMAEIQGMAKYTEREIRWCVTVPAIWDDEDKAVMRRAAVDAGFPDDPERLLLAIEPEAAALYCYLRMSDAAGVSEERGRLSLDEHGLRFMVVDCGGGTVDITAYETDSAAGQSIALREIGVATGGRLGSEYVNQAFRDKTLADRFGPAVLKRIERDHADDLLDLSDEWEKAKTTAELEWDEDGTARVMDPVYIKIPPTVWNLLDEPVRTRLTQEAGTPQKILVPPDEVQALLDEVVDGILEKVEEQLANIRQSSPSRPEAETIVLAGGFSRSEWLRERMRRRFGDRHRILIPPDPALAVLEGATHFAYNPKVFVSRQARYTYGFAMGLPFEHGVDPATRAYRDDDGDLLCTGRFQIAVRRMDSVKVNDTFPFQGCPAREDQPEVEIRLFRTAKADPRYVDEEGCEEIGRMAVDISSTIGRPLSERPLALLLYFGAAELRADAFDPGSGATTQVTVEFDRM